DERGGVVDHLDRRMHGTYPVDGALVHVGDHDLGTGLGEVADEQPADLADAFDADAPALQVRGAPRVLGARPHALVHAEGGELGGVARAALLAGPSRGEGGLPGDDVHVGDVGPDVAGGDVAAAERLDETPVGTEQRLG